MGSGPARTLEGGTEEVRVLDPNLSQRLGTALVKLDKLDPGFKTGRDEERFAQIVKKWNRIAKTMDEYLRAVGTVLHASHQLSLDIGVEGSGHNTKPWIEDVTKRLGRLGFRLEDSNINAVVGERSVGKIGINDLTYEWVEKATVDWLVTTVELKKPPV